MGTEKLTSPDMFIRLNSNTYLYPRSVSNLSSAPEKIKKRIAINQSGLNGLATMIIPPEITHHLTSRDLVNIIKKCNSINNNIGLPPTDSLVIRSAAINQFGCFSEPGLLVKNLEFKEVFQSLGNDSAGKYHSLSEYLSDLSANTFLMIHDDNYRLQIQSLQGRIGQSSDGFELFVGTGILHPRDIDRQSNTEPTIRISAQSIEDLIDFPIAAPIANYACEHTYVHRGANATFFNADIFQAGQLSRRLLREKYLIYMLYAKTTQHFPHPEAVEFRIYPLPEGSIGTKAHVLDLDITTPIPPNLLVR